MIRFNLRAALSLALAALVLTGVHSASAQTPVKVNAKTKKELLHLFDVVKRVCEMEYFSEGGVTNFAMIQFGILYNNNLGPYHKSIDNEGHYRLPAKYVEKIAMQYFGKTVKHETIGDIVYDNGTYYPTGSDAGEGWNTAITQVLDLGDGRYEVWARHRAIPEGEDAGEEIMTVRKVTSGRKSRYIVVAYAPLKREMTLPMSGDGTGPIGQ